MTRRLDIKTAELVDIALLTRAAFEKTMAEKYALLAGIPERLIDEIFSRPTGRLRAMGLLGYVGNADDRRFRVRH